MRSIRYRAKNSIALIALLVSFVSLLLSFFTWRSAVHTQKCEAQRAHANEIASLIIEVSHLAQNKIGLPETNYAPDGKPFLPSQFGPVWNANFLRVRELRNLLTAKVAVLGEEKWSISLMSYLDALNKLLMHRDQPENYDSLWDDLSIQTCEFTNTIRISVNSCLGIQTTPLDCRSPATRSSGMLFPSPSN